MRVKDLKLALAHYESLNKLQLNLDPTRLPKNVHSKCYDPNEPTYSIVTTVKWNIEYKLNPSNQLNVFEYPWLTMEENPLSPYSVY